MAARAKVLETAKEGTGHPCYGKVRHPPALPPSSSMPISLHVAAHACILRLHRPLPRTDLRAPRALHAPTKRKRLQGREPVHAWGTLALS